MFATELRRMTWTPRARYVPPVCLTLPGQVVEVVDADLQLASVDFAGVRRTVNVGLLQSAGPTVEPGDWVLVHVGFAPSRVDEAEALATRRLLEAMGAEYEQELAELERSAID